MRQDAADNREAIVTAARALFVEQGGNVSMRAIAKEAGVGIATVSRHFPDRLTLLDAIGADAVHDIEMVAYDPLITRAKEAGLYPADLEPLEFHIALTIASRPLPNSKIIHAKASQVQQELIDIFLDGLRARAT